MQTFYGTFLIIAYDPKKKKKSTFLKSPFPLVLAIVPYTHETRFAPGSCVGVTSRSAGALRFLNPNVGPKCELYSYINRV